MGLDNFIKIEKNILKRLLSALFLIPIYIFSIISSNYISIFVILLTSIILSFEWFRITQNNTYKEKLSEVGLVASGLSPDGRLVEIVEYLDHPFMAGTQFHPEFLSRPTAPHPLFKEFVGAVDVRNQMKENTVVMNGNLGGE